MSAVVQTKKRKFNRKDSIFIILMLAFPLANFLVFYVGINFNSILMAFQETNTQTFQSEWVEFAQFEKFFKAFSESPQLGTYIKNALLYFFITLIIGFPLNMLFAYMFFIKVRGTTALRLMIMIPTMISGLTLAMLFSKMAEYALPTLLNDWFGIETVTLLKDERYNFQTIILYTLITGFSSQVIIYSNAMNAVDDSIVESAKLDGATNLRILLSICVPMIYSTITTYMVTGVAGIFACSGGVFYQFYEYGAPENITPLGYYIFTLAKNNKSAALDYSYSAAISLLFTLITFPCVLLVKYIMEKFDPMREA